MNEPQKQPHDPQGTAEDLNLLATKAFHDLLEADKTLLPAWKDAALRLSENDVPQDVDALKVLMQGTICQKPRRTRRFMRWLNPILKKSMNCGGCGILLAHTTTNGRVS